MRIHHIGIAVEDLDRALEFYRESLGMQVTKRVEVPAEGVEIAFLLVGESEIELLRPLDKENSIGRFLANRGEGVHHICMQVDDIETAVNQLVEDGAQMATEIRSHPDGNRYVFVHPKSTHGVLLELYEEASNP